MELELEQLLNYSHVSENTDNDGNGIFPTVTRTLLWENDTAENLNKSLIAILDLRNRTVPILAEATDTGDAFMLATKALISDSRFYLKKIKMDTNFFA